MKKALLVATVSGFIPQFEMHNVRLLQELGYEVHYASNYNMPSYGTDNRRLDGTGIIRHQIDFVRSPYSLKNRKIFLQLKKLLREHQFQLVHCHTPMGGVMARLASHSTGTKPVIYTPHGFHFFQGAPLKNWLFYYPVERWLSRYTDQIVCINQEDYMAAQKFHSKYTDYIPGAGVNLKRIKKAGPVDVKQKKMELNLPVDKTICLSVGELIPRKNHETIIRAIARSQEKNFIYVICGHGELEGKLKKLVRDLAVEERVVFLGYRTDVLEIYQIADYFIFPSYQEGLPMAMLEAMASGLPVICSDIRGNRELIGLGRGNRRARWSYCAGGIIVEKANDIGAYAEIFEGLKSMSKVLGECRQRNLYEAEKFSTENVHRKMHMIYQRFDVEVKR